MKDVLQCSAPTSQTLLGSRIPADHSRTVLADSYAAASWPGPIARRRRDVLDLGCGAGDSVDLFRSLEPARELDRAPTSSESPEVAERTRSDADFVTFDGERLPFGDASFDLVYCKQVLEHVRRPEPLLAEVARVLAPGRHARRLDLPPRGLPLAQRLELHALRADGCCSRRPGSSWSRCAR